MKITVNKDELVHALSNVSRAVSSKSTIIVLEGILIKAANNQISLTGYDLEMGITTKISAVVREEGEIVLSARLFLDIVRKMPEEYIDIVSDQKLLTVVSSGMAQFTILGNPAADYPELPTVFNDQVIEIEDKVLKSMIDQTIYAVAVTDTKPVHMGSLFEVSDNSLTVISVDGFRLAIRKETMKFEENVSFIVPGKTLAEISKLITEKDKNVKILISKKHIVFSIDEYNVISRLLEGDFLNYKSAIAINPTIKIKVKTKNFIDSIERTSLLISDRVRSPLRLEFSDKKIKISCQTTMGKANDEILCELEGTGIEMAFNNKYLLDALKKCECDEVMLEAAGPLSPMRITAISGDSFLFLVLPVRF